MNTRRCAGAALGVLCAIGVVAAQASGPDLQVDQLASGPYSRMHMLLEKTIFSVDVMTVDVRYGAGTRDRLRTIADGHRYSDQLAPKLAQAVLGAQQAYVELRFVRDVSLERWMAGVREGLDHARRAGLIDAATAARVSQGLPQWFAAIAGRGFKDGDRILYRAYPDRMRTVLTSAQGDVLIDHVDEGDWPRRSMLAGYFAPGGDFREPLLRSLFET